MRPRPTQTLNNTGQISAGIISYHILSTFSSTSMHHLTTPFVHVFQRIYQKKLRVALPIFQLTQLCPLLPCLPVLGTRFERFRTSVANFAAWWDGLVEPPREGIKPGWLEGWKQNSLSTRCFLEVIYLYIGYHIYIYRYIIISYHFYPSLLIKDMKWHYFSCLELVREIN